MSRRRILPAGIQAADHGITLGSLDAEVSATLDSRAGSEGNEHITVYHQSITYTVILLSSASAEEIARISEAVEKRCPILNLLRRGNDIIGRVDHIRPELKEVSAA